MTLLVPVILSGGSGSRLWPVSREGHPKPFMKLADGQSLLEKTYRRAINLSDIAKKAGKSKLVTVTNRDYYFMSRDELSKAEGVGTFLLEPFGRNTAPAIAIAAHHLLESIGDDVVMLVLPSDHLVSDEKAFSACVKKAFSLAKDGYLVTFGIAPTGPATGFGYIQQGNAISSGYHVKRFVEKPNAEFAQEYVDAGGYLWNSGMFCFEAKTFLRELAIHAPSVAKNAENCWAEVHFQSRTSDFLEVPEQVFADAPNVSIDFALMEKSSKVVVIPGSFDWNDIGSWSSVRDLLEPNLENNRSIGDAIFINSSNTFVQADSRVVAVVGVQDLIVVDTQDALLVVNPSFTQDVKQLVSKLKNLGHSTAMMHKTVMRPWGNFRVLCEGVGFKMKLIEVNPGACLSLQSHAHRSEHWVVVKGQATVVNGDSSLVINENESTYIPACHRHRLANQSSEILVVVEVQCGSYLGEDDIFRFEDNYGRI